VASFIPIKARKLNFAEDFYFQVLMSIYEYFSGDRVLGFATLEDTPLASFMREDFILSRNLVLTTKEFLRPKSF
jgi:hypothetical protein